MKPDCPACRTGKCKPHKTSRVRKLLRRFGPKRWYWELIAAIKGENK